MDDIPNIYGVDFSHLRLLDLTKLADQAEPFYHWVEKKFQLLIHSGDSFDSIIKRLDIDAIQQGILSCYLQQDLSTAPKLFDGGGSAYEHKKACFFFFSWLARDAAVQRLYPLVNKSFKNFKIENTQKKLSNLELKKSKLDIETKALALLLFTYKEELKYFDWKVFREVALSRLEGSRRAKKGSAIEMYVRTAITVAFSYYYKTRGNYGNIIDFEILDKPLKIKNRTYDVAAKLFTKKGKQRLIILPVKTRETQGGGHSHLFSRDIEQANQEILAQYPDAYIVSVIIAQNWSIEEITIQENLHGNVFYFDENPNRFAGFDEVNQQKLNHIIEVILDNEL